MHPWILRLLGPCAVLAGLVLLAAHPLLWLVGTWFDPAYDSPGLWVAGLTGALLLWSASSPVLGADPRRRWGGLGLLALTALVRLLGQRLGVNILGAAALVLDAYAIGLLLDLDRRARPLSPGWLAVLFAFALPLERVLQRGLGFALQQVSAAGACGLLGLGAPVQCQGIEIRWQGASLLVDLPCSGTRGLLLLLLLYAALAALIRPGPGRAWLGVLLAVSAATLGNSLRIVALAVGLAYQEELGGLDLLAEPWHGAIGLLALGLAAVPLLVWARSGRGRVSSLAPPIRPPGAWVRVHPAVGLLFLALCAGVLAVPARPLDVARPQPDPELPVRIARFTAQPGHLTAQEQTYFTRYGGGASRAAYGPHGLLLVSTSAPLRHLHAPEECLTGAGHQVRYLGRTEGPIPSALYRSTDPQGRDWRVAVTYVSERGERATQVAEAVWHWLQAPGTGWRMVQRASPWDLPDTLAQDFDQALWRALELPLSP